MTKIKTTALLAGEKKLFWLYSLELEHGKFYIGISTMRDPQRRIKQHGRTYGARWTKIHKPVRTIEIIRLGRITQEEADAQENKRTKQYMRKYGYQNVRGGNVTSPEKLRRLGPYMYEPDSYDLLIAGIVLLLMTCVAVYALTFK